MSEKLLFYFEDVLYNFIVILFDYTVDNIVEIQIASSQFHSNNILQ